MVGEHAREMERHACAEQICDHRVAELVRRGTEVIYYLTEGQRARIEATGATFKPYDTIHDDYFDVHKLCPNQVYQ